MTVPAKEVITGLNLPIRRVLFSTLTRYDGQADRRLEVGGVHQIAGRAGRCGMHEEGFVSVLAEAEATALRILKDLLPRTPEAPVDFKAPVAPTGSHIATSSQRLNKTALRELLGVFMEPLKLDDAHFGVAELEVRGHSVHSGPERSQGLVDARP